MVRLPGGPPEEPSQCLMASSTLPAQIQHSVAACRSPPEARRLHALRAQLPVGRPKTQTPEAALALSALGMRACRGLGHGFLGLGQGLGF